LPSERSGPLLRRLKSASQESTGACDEKSLETGQVKEFFGDSVTRKAPARFRVGSNTENRERW
jgi:hypothetical protein